MRKLVFSLLPTLFLLFSCNEGLNPQSPASRTYKIKASSQLTKTSLSMGENNIISWTENQDRLRIFETVDGVSISLESEPCVLVDGQGLFEFTLPEERLSENGNSYDAVYPSSAWVEGNNDVSEMLLNLKNIQSSKRGTFDPEADILVAKTMVLELPTADVFEAQFKRLVAISNMTINNLNTADEILSVKFTASGKTLSGHLSVNLSEGQVLNYGADDAKDNVCAKFDAEEELVSGDNVIFTCFPATINSGETFSVEVCTETTKYSKTFTVPAARKLEFKAGDISTFSVNMSGAKEEPVVSKNTQFYIVANYGGDYYAMSTASAGSKNDKLGNVNVKVVGNEVKEGSQASIIWTFTEQANGNYLISNDGNYLSTAANKTILLTTEPTEFALTKNADNSYVISLATNESRQLRYNANSGQEYFCFYESDKNAKMIGDFLIIPYSGGSGIDGDEGGEEEEDNEVIINSISISKKSNTSVGVYILGVNLKSASSVKVFYKSSSSAEKSVVSEISEDGGFASAIISGLTPNIPYTFWAVATLPDLKTVKTGEYSYTIEESALSPSAGWLELPSQTSISGTNQYTFSYSSERNYTILYDPAKLSSLWVAYPLASGHIGSLERPSNWSYAPSIPNSSQADVRSGSYKPSGNYSRGHQIPNADRNGIAEMQKQAFYVVNSTPQIQNGFNGGIWNSLEDAIRNEIPASDSLYIVTGPVFGEGSKTINDNGSTPKVCAVATHFFKIVLKVKRSAGVITNAKAIGFWFEHKAYDDSYTNYAVSVDQIEALTGFDFYSNLPDEIETVAENNESWSEFTKF